MTKERTTSMTGAQVAALIAQLGVSPDRLADLARAKNARSSMSSNTITRYIEDRRRPNHQNQLALARVWLDAGYPCTANGQPAVLTTRHPASADGVPVIAIGGQAVGPDEAGPLDLGDAPDALLDLADLAGYEIG